jgi:signal transduction histidine kinase
VTFKFRSRVFLYLLLLLLLFVVSQAAIYLVVEAIHFTGNPYESMWEGLFEVAQAMGMTLLLIPPWAVAAWWISRWMMRPLRRMAETAGRIRGGQWFERIETETMPDDETKSLADTVNAAFDGYAAVLRRLERFSGDAAHQLRTPIAAMRGLGEVALSRSRTAEEYRETLETMLGELDRLTRIVEQLLQLSRLDAGALRVRFSAVSLGRVLEQVQQIYQPLAEANAVRLAVEAGPVNLQVEGIEELLVELLGNLVDNALRHTPAGGDIRIRVSRPSEREALLTVNDSGPGIPAEFAQKIFDRFTQVPGAESGTAGLGLSLAAEIAAVHGGRLTLANPGQPGAHFECRLPAAAVFPRHGI